MQGNARIKMMMGVYPNRSGGVERGGRSAYSQEKYKFFLEAPFEISNKCCNVMKKNPAHAYFKKTNRKPMTAEMASESRLRTQKWIQNGCNGFDLKIPKSTPMAFWTEQDVLLYIRENNLPIAKPYGEVLTEDELSGQMTIAEYLQFAGELDMASLFEADLPVFCTTGCQRTGCVFCGFGSHIDTGRFANIDKVSNPKLRDYCMRGGAFDENGLWKPTNEGLGMWFVIKWINVHGGFKIEIPEYERYEREYGNELTRMYLEEN